MAVTRLNPGPRMSQAVIHGDTVFLSGQVAFDAPGESVAAQTTNVLSRIDALLAEAGTSKANLLSATIWISDISTFNEMNEVWDAWVDKDAAPTRACVESKLASPKFVVEIAVTASVG